MKRCDIYIYIYIYVHVYKVYNISIDTYVRLCNACDFLELLTRNPLHLRNEFSERRLLRLRDVL